MRWLPSWVVELLAASSDWRTHWPGDPVLTAPEAHDEPYQTAILQRCQQEGLDPGRP